MYGSDPPIEKTEKITKVVVTIIGRQRPEERDEEEGEDVGSVAQPISSVHGAGAAHLELKPYLAFE